MKDYVDKLRKDVVFIDAEKIESFDEVVK